MKFVKMNMKAQSFNININENKVICCQLFENNNSNIVLIIASAMGVKQSFYQNFAEFANSYNVSVITFDYSGIGKSLTGNIKKHKEFLHDWGNQDLEMLIRYAIEKFPNHRKVVLGHSVGGQLIGLAPSSVYLDKIILVSAQSGFWGFWKGFNEVKMFLNWHLLFPMLTSFFGYMPSKRFSKMENLSKNVANEWSKWCRNPDYLFGYFSDDELFFNKMRCNLLSISVADDFFAPEQSVEWLSKKYKNAEVTRKHLVPIDFGVSKIGHFDMFRSKFKNSFWEFLLEEIKN
ncbi:hypothetical protein CMV04_18165 [Elizabethkingia anophelis]|nr:hypothetical protein [Elizabethkingia anophelis]